jgi:hypothetical protein
MKQYNIDTKSMDFVASISKINRSQIKSIVSELEDFGLVEDGLRRVMFCPLTAPPSIEETVKSISEEYGLHVSCDSGGYESQVSDKYSMRDIYLFDKDYYSENDWPDEYVLPDQVPMSGDDEKTIEHKVQDTISLSRMLHTELPEKKQKHSLPVVQGHTKQQIVDCIEAYKEFDNIQKIGFGSFSTGGVNGGVNYLNEEKIELLQFVVKEAQKYGLNVHAFGVGGPTSVPILYRCGVDTFDSTGWIRSAGYGNVIFPFKSRFNITHRRDRSGSTVFHEELAQLKSDTGHECPYCESFEKLQESRLFRILHNLLVMREMAESVHDYSISETLDIMNSKSKYTKYLEKMAAD